MKKSKKVLIIEDEELIAKAYSQHLQKEGYQVAVTFDGEEGLKQVKEFKPDLIILDIVMPKLDGVEVLKRIKENSNTRHVPVIVLTNLSDKESIAEILAAGGTHYLVKIDCKLTDLSQLVAKELNL